MTNSTELIWDEKTNKCSLVTKIKGGILIEPITTKQAAQWLAENKF